MKKYYCSKCEKHHHRGKIFKKHLTFKKEEVSKFTDYENLSLDLESLRPIAKRQLSRLLKKMNLTGNHELYKKEIIKLIKNERKK
ncbi:MAG: hypothetical protein ACFFFB_08610 [Candidatus Heimdallarchaeota archaeon]